MRDLLHRIDLTSTKTWIAIASVVALLAVALLWPRGGNETPATPNAVPAAPAATPATATPQPTAQPIATTTPTDQPGNPTTASGSATPTPSAPEEPRATRSNGHRLYTLDPKDQWAPRNPDAEPAVAAAGADIHTWWDDFQKCVATGKDWRICELESEPSRVKFIDRKRDNIRLQVTLDDGRKVLLFIYGDVQCHALVDARDCNAW